MRLNAVGRALVDRRASPRAASEIGRFVAEVVAGWDAKNVVDKLELQVGRDLQYIRINGALVGGLVGLAIFAAARALGLDSELRTAHPGVGGNQPARPQMTQDTHSRNSS